MGRTFLASQVSFVGILRCLSLSFISQATALPASATKALSRSTTKAFILPRHIATHGVELRSCPFSLPRIQSKQRRGETPLLSLYLSAQPLDGQAGSSTRTEQEVSPESTLTSALVERVDNVTFWPKQVTTNSADSTGQDINSNSSNNNWKSRLRIALPGSQRLEARGSRPQRRSPGLDALDRTVLATAIPSMINLAVVPIVNTVDTFWVGRMGIALALSGQAAANQAFFTLYFLVNYLPTITAPMVAEAVGSNNTDLAQHRVCESIFVSNLLGFLGTLALVGKPEWCLRLILPPSSAPHTLAYAAPYLRYRALSMIPALVSATGFAAYRGRLDTVTPLKVSLATNLLNLVLDPLLMFTTPLRVRGAALATAISETASGVIYLHLLLKNQLARWSLLLRPPSWSSLLPLIQGGISMLGRQAAINVALVTMARRAQALDPTGGVAAAAHGIVMQLYSVGIVVHVAMQGTAAAMVSATRAARGDDAARQVADRLFVWGTVVGCLLGLVQFAALPMLVPLFSTLPQVQKAVKLPALLVSLLHVINGPVFVGEGTMLGLKCYRDLMLLTAGGVATLVASVAFSPLGHRLEGIMLSNILFCTVQAVAVVIHYLKFGPLAMKRERR